MDRRMRRALLWAIAILVLTLMPSDDVPAWGWAQLIHLDKLVHAGLFGVLTVLLGLAWSRPGQAILRTALAALLVAVAYGGAIELLQEVMQLGRHAEWADLAADSAGAALGVAFLLSPIRARVSS